MSKPLGPYTPIMRAGDWLVSSGQIGMIEGKLVSGGVVAELKQALENLRGLLEQEGADITKVVKITIFMRHMRDYQLMNDTYAEFFGEHRPARSALAVSELPGHALIEVEAWAYVGS